MVSQIAVRTEKELVDILFEDISGSRTVALVAGEFPLIYHSGERRAESGISRWGEFSMYTFELGCMLARQALDWGKDVRILVVADDHVELPLVDGARKVRSWMKRVQRGLYAQGLPEEFEASARRWNVLEHIAEESRSFGPSKVISEIHLKSIALNRGIVVPNECSLAYTAMLDLLCDPHDYVIGFIPGQCKGFICDGVLDRRINLNATHVFFPHIELLGGILDTGKGFVKVGDGMKIAEAYSAGLVSYVKNKSR